MKLSIIIVNYNVQYFLENCLRTVFIAADQLGDCEVFVVDNNSVDGSMQMVKEKFPQAIRIENKENVGFSKANNQAITQSKGEFVLLLNPDTIVEENTFLDCYNYANQNPEMGGLGVYMVDGKGVFLPESKRGLPKPSVAFYKIFGLAALFPKSKQFGQYHLGYLDNHEINEIDVLSGAYMWLRKETLDKVGLLDESFFMYGEDIDLSYRITKGGYKNIYFPKARIIHYKGESTKKSSINYVFVFYKAMVIFAKKHFSKQNAKLFSFFINLAIYLRAFLAVLSRFLKQIALPLLDIAILLIGMFFFKEYYEANYRFTDGGEYPEKLINYGFTAIACVIVISNFLSEAYSQKGKIKKLFRGIILGGIVVLSTYSLLDESFRFSRALVLFSIIWALIALPLFRLILHISGLQKLKGKIIKRIAIIGSINEIDRIKQFLKETFVEADFIATISADNNIEKENSSYLGKLYQLADIVEIYKINEIIFCSKDLSSEEIISNMAKISDVAVEFKIAPPESLYIIGSNSIQNSGEFYILDTNSITKKSNLRKKRAFDVFFAFIILLLSPVLFLFQKEKKHFFKNCWNVFIGKLSWVSFHWEDKSKVHLPQMKNGILLPISGTDIISKELIAKANYQYSRNYAVSKDATILMRNIHLLGGETIVIA